MDAFGDIVVLVLAFLIGVTGAVLVWANSVPNYILLERGIIQYCSPAGEIAFTGECEDR